MARQQDHRKCAEWQQRLRRFERPGEERVRIDSTQLAMILGGVRLESARR